MSNISRQRYSGRTSSGQVTYYGPAGLEKSTTAGITSWRHELGSAVVLRQGSSDTVSYIARDRIGSVVAVMEANGTQRRSRSYDAFGQAKDGDYSPRANGNLGLRPTTLRGFTEHEHVDEVQDAARQRYALPYEWPCVRLSAGSVPQRGSFHPVPGEQSEPESV